MGWQICRSNSGNKSFRLETKNTSFLSKRYFLFNRRFQYFQRNLTIVYFLTMHNKRPNIHKLKHSSKKLSKQNILIKSLKY